ncbi:hypothetical protein HWI79_2536 [Cryptosporidium felis]|nr:hypothetical protein HWI79_2536 [Cryptosporidium felis]
MSFSASLLPRETVSEMEGLKASSLAQSPVLIYSASEKMASSQVVPDSPPTMLISASSSPSCNIVSEKEDSYPGMSNFYSQFTRISEELKNKEASGGGLFPYGFVAPSPVPGAAGALPPVGHQTGAQLLPPSLVNNSQTTGGASPFGAFGLEGGASKSKSESPAGGFPPYSGSQIDWSNAMSAYYQQLALYNQMAMAMYSPILAAGYGGVSASHGCPGPLLGQVYPGWQSCQMGNSATSGGSNGSAHGCFCSSGGDVGGGGGFPAAPVGLFDLQAGPGQQIPAMVPLGSLPQIRCSGPVGSVPPPQIGAIGGSIGLGGVPQPGLAGAIGNNPVSVSGSPIHSSQSIPSSMLSPMSASQGSNARSPLGALEGGFEISKSVGAWSSKMGLKHSHRKGEKNRKAVKAAGGGRRKIDKSSAICVVCGTTQTSQWRFLNMSELFAPPHKDESPSPPRQDTNEPPGSLPEQAPAPGDGGSPLAAVPLAQVDKQICCNACYMKYDRNRPRYRNGKKAPPPLPPYLYSQGQFHAETKSPNGLDHFQSYKQEAPFAQSE